MYSFDSIGGGGSYFGGKAVGGIESGSERENAQERWESG